MARTGRWLQVWERGEVRRLLETAALAAALIASPALANPSGGQVRAGAADITRNGSTLSIHQHTDRAIIDWQRFSIDPSELTRFVQPGASSAVLNRVTGGDPSALLGSLQANGQVYLINPNGVLVGAGAAIQTQSFVASTLDVSNAAFLAGGELIFSGGSNAAVVNRGAITALGGDVYLIARTVENAGTIQAADGAVALAAGYEVLLKQAGDERLFVLAGTPPGADPGVDPGAGASPGAGAGGVTNSGRIEAAQAELIAAGGNIYALAINQTGTIRATGAEHRGGRILLTATDGRVQVAGTLDTSHATGQGGTIHVLGEQIHLEGALLDASGAAGGGAIRVGGDFLGQGALATAQSTTVDADSVLRADATQAGDGGSVVVWSDGTTTFHGAIQARGAGAAGVGGDAEVSGKQHLLVTGHADLRGPGGAGTFLLDPGSVSIVSGADAPNGALDTFTDGWINAQLANSSLAITTASSTNGQTENLTVEAGAYVLWNSGNDLTLEAGHDILIEGIVEGTGAGSLTLRADTNADGAGTVTFGDDGRVISTGGGDVTIYYNPTSYASPTDYGSANTYFDNGGSLTAYMLVNNVHDLQAIATNLAGTYALNTDLDASVTSTWNGGAGFDPIGDVGSDFTGIFDGDGHAITGLFIYRPDEDRVGLFGRVNGGVVRNVGLLDVDITGKDLVGGLAGQTYSPISDAHVTGAVSGNTSVGGLVGQNEYNTISRSYADVTVNGNTRVGGLVGSSGGTISQAYATGAVNGTSNVGGLVGANGERAVIENAYATAAVSGDTNVGGLVGENRAPHDPFDDPGAISNSWASGAVTGNTQVGGLVGYTNDDSLITHSFWDTTTTGQATSAGGTGKTTAELLAQATYAGWDFTSDWFILGGETRPFLRMEHSTTITNAHQLQLMAMDLGATYTLAADLDLSGLQNPAQMWSARGFVPIGTYNASGGDAFEGVFDGGGHTISNLFINRTTDYVGLFGGARGATIRNVGLDGGSVSGKDYVGALVAYFNTGGSGVGDSLIEQVWSTVDVTGTKNSIGGLVGEFRDGTLTQSWASGTVAGQRKVGGLIGWKSGGAVSHAHATGAVTGDYEVGGLVGHQLSGGSITHVYATGAVSGSRDSVGGLVGDNRGTISGSYATGAVTGSDYNIGGLVGYNAGHAAVISQSYATGAVTGSGAGGYLVGGLVGYNDGGTISGSYATGAVVGGDAVGGLVGLNHGTISQSYATGAVTSTNDSPTGGLVGDNTGTISQSYATGAVTGGEGLVFVGGLTGTNFGTISQSYAIGAVTGSGDYVGGLAGYNEGQVLSSFWDIGTTGQTTSAGGGVGKYTPELMTSATYAGWDFDTVWALEHGKSYAYHQWRYPDGVQVASGRVQGVGGGEQVALIAGGAYLAHLQTFADGTYYHLFDPGTVGAGEGLLIYGGGGNAFGMSNGDTAHFTGMSISANYLWIYSPLAAASDTALLAAKADLSDTAILYTESKSGAVDLKDNVNFTLNADSSFTFERGLGVWGTGHVTLDGASTIANAVTLSVENGWVDIYGDVTAEADLVIYAGSDVNVYGEIQADGNNVTLFVGQGVWGGRFTLDGEVHTTGSFTVTGGAGNDTFRINTLVSDLTLDAGEGDDTVHTQLFAGAAQNLVGGDHATGDTLHIDGQEATFSSEDSPLAADGFGTVTYSQFEQVTLTNATIEPGTGGGGGSGGGSGGGGGSSGRYEVVDGSSLVDRGSGGQNRNLTRELRHATDTPATGGQPGSAAPGSNPGGTGAPPSQTGSSSMNPMLGYDRRGQGQVGGEGQGGDWQVGASSFDLFDASTPTADEDAAPQE